MNVSRNVVTDLLPIYFAGEASEDTRSLVEECFRQDPEFERIARRAATPLYDLRQGQGAALPADSEKLALQRTRAALRSRTAWMVFAIVWMLAPFSFVFSHGHITWIMLRDNPLQAAMFLAWSVLCWIAYFVKRRWPHLQGF